MTNGGGQSDDDLGECGTFASPPFYMHEIDPAFGGIVDPVQSRNVARRRKAERERLMAARLALSFGERTAHAERLAAELDAVIGKIAPRSVSLYRPLRCEPDLRSRAERAHDRGVRIALPVVIAKGQPLVFQEWRPGAPLTRGVWSIPYPADEQPLVPDVVIAPLVGFDPAGYRLGHGGGFFDWTLTALAPRPVAIGVGDPTAAIATICPQSHDLAMDWILLGDGSPRPHAHWRRLI